MSGDAFSADDLIRALRAESGGDFDNPFPQAPICVQCGVDRAEYVGGGRYGTKCQSCAEMALAFACVAG